MGMPSFVLSTIHTVQASSKEIPQYVPRARTIVFRGMWTELPKNRNNPAERNPSIYESDMLSITTDARMEKAGEIMDSATPSVARPSYAKSGGGGPVEAAFWMPKNSTQWRIRGKAYILGPDIEDDTPEAKSVRSTLLARMRKTTQETTSSNICPQTATPSWSWTREVTAHFGNLSPVMRGSFRNPPPGVPVSQPLGDERLGFGHEITDLNDEVARSNFRVVVIVPEEVDQIDLSDIQRCRRWIHRWVEEGGASQAGGGWEVEEVYP
jgi:pyridoxamine 5'-phosphate oxidase